jgi:hypothetical protein
VHYFILFYFQNNYSYEIIFFFFLDFLRLTEEKKSIQMVVALILQLIQSCAILPKNNDSSSLDLSEDRSTFVFEEANKVAQSFLKLLLPK